MGYFDALSDGCFKRAGSNWVFFPWGTLGRGYTIPSDAEYLAIRSSVKCYLLISLPLIVFGGFVFGWLVSLLLLPPIGLFYLLRVRSLTKRLGTSNERLTIRESYRAQATSHSTWLLWVLEVASIFFVVVGVLILLADPQGLLVGLAGIVFFGLCAVAIGYMIRAKRTLPPSRTSSTQPPTGAV